MKEDMNRRLIAWLFLMFSCVATWGAKAYPFPVQVQQADGTILTIRLHGDEHMNYATTTDGVLLFSKDNNYYVATTRKKSKPSGFRTGTDSITRHNQSPEGNASKTPIP